MHQMDMVTAYLQWTGRGDIHAVTKGVFEAQLRRKDLAVKEIHLRIETEWQIME